MLLQTRTKKVLKRYAELFDEIKNQIEAINGGKPIKYKQKLMKITFDSDHNDLSLDKILNIPVLNITDKSVFQNNNKYYLQIHMHECVSMDYNKHT